MGLGTWLGFLFGVLAPFFVAELGWSDLQAGSLTSVMYAAGALAAPLAGWSVDRLGARRTALLVPGIVAVAHLVVAAARSFPVIAAGAVIGGLSLAATNPSTNRLVVEGVTPEARGRVMGWKQAGVSVAGFTVGALVPALASAAGWRVGAAAGAAVALTALPLLRRSLPPPLRSTGDGGERPSAGPRVHRISAYAGVMGAVNGALGAYIVLYAVGTLGLTAQTGGAAVATFGLVAVGARVGWATAGGRLGRYVPLLRAISLLSAAALVAVALAPVGAALVVLVAAGVLGGTAMSWHALAMLAAVSGVAIERIGRVSGSVTRAFYGGYVAGPIAFGLLVDNGVAYRTGWVVVAMLALIATAVPTGLSDRDDRPAGARVDGGHPG